MTKSDLRFEINQLRQDKIIYAVESVATTAAALMAIFILSIFGPSLGPTYNIEGFDYPIAPVLIGTAAIIYWVYASLGNLKRYKKVRQLEAELLKI